MKKSLNVSMFQRNNFMHESEIKRGELIVLSEVCTQVISSFSSKYARERPVFLKWKKVRVSFNSSKHTISFILCKHMQFTQVSFKSYNRLFFQWETFVFKFSRKLKISWCYTTLVPGREEKLKREQTFPPLLCSLFSCCCVHFHDSRTFR